MRVATRRLPLAAAIGDFIVFLLFPFIGASSHAMGLTPETFVRTVIPFTIAWAAVAFVAGAFRPGFVRSTDRALKKLPLIWLAAGVLGVAIRALLFNRFDLVFSLVAIGVMGVMLLIWRLLFAALQR